MDDILVNLIHSLWKIYMRKTTSFLSGGHPIANRELKIRNQIIVLPVICSKIYSILTFRVLTHSWSSAILVRLSLLAPFDYVLCHYMTAAAITGFSGHLLTCHCWSQKYKDWPGTKEALAQEWRR